MNRKTIMGLIVLVALPFPVLAEDDLRVLIKALSAQVAELNEQVKHSNQRIAELERKLQEAEKHKQETPGEVASTRAGVAAPSGKATPAPAPAGTIAAATTGKDSKPAVTVGDAKGTFKIPGTDTSLGFGGFAKLDVNFNSISAGRDRLGDQLLVVSQIPVGENRAGENSQMTFVAKSSRLWFKSFTPSSWGDINTFLEIDFFGSADTYAYTPRLRHAYGSVGNFLGGFTWTTFLNTFAIPDTLDLTGPAGLLAPTRQPMVRWTQPLPWADKSLEFQAALEAPQSRFWAAPENDLVPNVYGFTTPDDERYPDLIARLNYNPEWGSISLSGMGRQIRYSKAGTSGQQQAWGGALSLAGKITTTGLDNARFMLSYGNVLGRYATFNTFEDATLDTAGHLQLVNSYSAMLAYQHWWNTTWRSTVAYGFAQTDQPAFVSGDITRQAQSVHVNLLWSPLLRTTFGLEYIYATRTTVNDESGDLHRITLSTQFNF